MGPQPGQAFADAITGALMAAGGEPTHTITAVHVEDTDIPPPDHVEVVATAPLQLGWVTPGMTQATIVGTLGLFAMAGAGNRALGAADTITTVFFAVVGVGFGAFLVYVAAALAMNRTGLAVKDGVLTKRTGPLPMPRGTQQARLEDVVDVVLWREDRRHDRRSYRFSTTYNVVVATSGRTNARPRSSRSGCRAPSDGRWRQRRQRPLLPPPFSRSCTPSRTMSRSAALPMS